MANWQEKWLKLMSWIQEVVGLEALEEEGGQEVLGHHGEVGYDKKSLEALDDLTAFLLHADLLMTQSRGFHVIKISLVLPETRSLRPRSGV